jgi:hypothetical protein
MLVQTLVDRNTADVAQIQKVYARSTHLGVGINAQSSRSSRTYIRILVGGVTIRFDHDLTSLHQQDGFLNELRWSRTLNCEIKTNTKA